MAHPVPPRAHLWRARPVAAALAAALLVLGPWTACGGEPQLPALAERWSAVVVVLDAMPAGALGCYGYGRDTTPRIDRFAAGAVRFESVWSAASYTLASTASLFTGLEPGVHGVVGLRSNGLAPGHRTLAEAFREAGFATAGLSTNSHVTAEGGFAQGFEHFEHYRHEDQQVHHVPPGLIENALGWWRDNADRRRFLYLHVLPPHQPYAPPPPHDALFGAEHSEVLHGSTPFLLELKKGPPLDPQDPRLVPMRARYDAGLHYADAVFGELLDGLAAAGALEHTVVVLLSDHGEAFGEHGAVLHGSTVFREMCEVPLIVSWPNCQPGLRADLTRTRDLAATLAQLFELEWERGGHAGHSFLDQLLDPEWREERSALTRSEGSEPVWALRRGPWTLIEQRASGTRWLCDRGADRGELLEVSAQFPRELDELSAELGERLDEARRQRERRGLEPERVSRWLPELRELGYTGED